MHPLYHHDDGMSLGMHTGWILEWNHARFEFESDFDFMVSNSDPVSTRNQLDGFDFVKKKYIEGFRTGSDYSYDYDSKF